MTIAREDVVPDTLRYNVRGTLDADASQAMRDAEREPAPESVVVIDLRQCSGMDDFGFGSLVGLIRRAREHHARVQLAGADDALRDELRRTGVARLVELIPEHSDTELVAEHSHTKLVAEHSDTVPQR